MIRVGYIGRKRILDKIRSIVFRSAVAIDYVDKSADVKLYDVILVDRALVRSRWFTSLKRCVTISDSTYDVVMTLLNVIVSTLTHANIVIGIDLGASRCGLIVLVNDVPYIHLRTRPEALLKLVDMILSRYSHSVTIHLGASSSVDSRLVVYIAERASMFNARLNLIDESSLRDRRQSLAHRFEDLSDDELDALMLATTRFRDKQQDERASGSTSAVRYSLKP